MPFQPNLMFVFKATTRVKHLGAPLQGRFLALPTNIRQGHGGNKHSSLSGTFINYGRKKFYYIRPRPTTRLSRIHVIKDLPIQIEKNNFYRKSIKDLNKTTIFR